MSKVVKIRFIENYNKEGNKLVNVYAEEKKWYGWSIIGYLVGTIGGSLFEAYKETSKEKLLNVIVDKYYETTKKHLIIKEYPTIKFFTYDN